MQDKIKVLMVCHGNICRSTMAQSIFTHLVHRQHLDAVFEIDSAATSREQIGNPPHYGTKNKLYEEHIPLIPHRARQMTRDDYLYYDLLTLREPPMRILFLLAKQFRQICLTKKMSQEGLSQTEIASKLGVPSFVVRNLASCARSYTVEELENAVRDFVDAEEAVKTGTLGDVLSVELLIVKYSSARAVRA